MAKVLNHASIKKDKGHLEPFFWMSCNYTQIWSLLFPLDSWPVKRSLSGCNSIANYSRVEAGTIMNCAIISQTEYTVEQYCSFFLVLRESQRPRQSDLQQYSFLTDIKSHNGEQCCNGNGNLCRYNCLPPLCTRASFCFCREDTKLLCYYLTVPLLLSSSPPE